ncbi:upstream stimulatory factor 2-like [Eriocheir sinensis]|uniref:upstream stimulatory factor 2-like n=1 Tax=Eriocheir sinensis TaxID=95602 RepID=UPI0021C6B463|nr:upstream stimulatory factor 2-like [Eriocheir sinensis]XP_050718062.1 upstream stimulatory factor 2-like [Eriocheir sinensis]
MTSSSPMDMIETALDSSGDKDCECEDDKVSLAQRLALDDAAVRDSASPILAPGFALRTESEHSGTLAYRVVQFTPDGGVDGLPQGTVPGTVTSLLASPQANGSPAESPETRLALITQGDVSSDGQFYVISDVLTTTTPRNLAPRASESVISPRLTGSTREEKRRVTHNEVERRRRDKINTWIYRLAKIIPDCPEAHTKNSQSKGGILAKACDYITELRNHNDQLTERIKETQRREMDYNLLKQELEVLKNENAALKNENALVRAQLQQQGLLGDLPP